MLVNLITNAVKYSPNADKIDINVEQKEQEQVSVSIKDYGIGIDKADQKNIFDRFYRVEGKNEKTFPGFGIGLFIAKDIINRHGGSLVVESEKNHGSVFTFTLPVSEEDLP